MMPLARLTIGLAAIASIAACDRGGSGAGRTHDDLVTLFREWRAFQRPPLVDSIADYSAGAMRTQQKALGDYQRRLRRIDTTGWAVAQQVDYHLVRAEMNGLEFDHRVLQPWARNPAFYVSIFPSQSDVPAREGPVAYGAIELWEYQYPLTPQTATDLRTKLLRVGPTLSRARTNLTGDARDLWRAGTRAMRDQSTDLVALAGRVAGTDAELDRAIQLARAATDSFADWLEAQASTKTEPSGVGIENYDWFLRNVHLVPFTWAEQVVMMKRELARALSALALEERRNGALPPQALVSSQEEHQRRFGDAVTEYMDFLRLREIVSIREYMDPALRERTGRFSPATSERPYEFFTQVDYRDPVVMRTHGYHWFDLARMKNEPHASPIRRVPLLYNIFDERAEGMATGMEEMMMHAGLFDAKPRSRELIWILLAQRAARALGDLWMHSNTFTMDEAVKYASVNTPRGWLPETGNTVWGEQHLYLQQPSYGTSYLVGKAQIEQLLGERRRQLGADFTLRQFMDELNAAGMIPVTLIRWELTGQGDEIARLTSR